MKDRLKPKGLEETPSGISIRWKNHAQWEKQILKTEGYLKKDSPRGTWEITDKGRKHYENLKQRQQISILNSKKLLHCWFLF